MTLLILIVGFGAIYYLGNAFCDAVEGFLDKMFNRG